MNYQGNDFDQRDQNKEPVLRIWREINARDQMVQQSSSSDESEKDADKQTVN